MNKIIFISTILLFNFLFASSLESLLKEYEDSSKESLQTLNEKMGHARIYSQKELKLMQYTDLSDILKELPILNLNKSAFGTNTLSLPGSKNETTGYFRLFINNHEVNSVHTQSPFLNWFSLPIDLIDYVEVYYGEGSFTLGSDTGVKFIRVYTKKGSKENGTNLKTTVTNKSSNLQEFTHSSLLENGWSYLLYYANQNSFFKRFYNNQKLRNNSHQEYFFLDLSNTNNSINIAYNKLDKDNYKGLSFDANSDSGEIKSDHLFIDYNRYFLDDKSLKLNLSMDIQNRDYNENDASGIAVVASPGYLGSAVKSYHEDLKFTKTNFMLSKEFKGKKNNLFTAINIKNKKYDTNNRTINNVSVGQLSSFDEETSYSFLIQNDYEILENLILIGNFKIDKYQREGYLGDSTETLYRIGSIYLPNENLGFKTFYTISHIPPSFYNTDFVFTVNPNLKSQKYKYFTSEGAYVYGKSRISLEYFNVNIDDYIYFVAPLGFMNINDHTIKTDGFVFDYIYNLDSESKFELNYYASQLSEVKNGYTQGGYIKYMKDYDKFSYFTSLIYRDGFKYQGLKLNNSYNLSLGATYNFTKNLSLSLKGENLLNKSTQTILADASPNPFAPTLSLLDDYDRTLSFSLKWRF